MTYLKPISGLLALCSLTLAACAPVVAGSQSYQPIVQSSPLTPTKLAHGTAVFVEYTYAAGVISDDDSFTAPFSALNFDYSQARTGNTVPSPTAPAPWLRLKSTNAPAGLSVLLDQANMTRTVKSSRLTADGSVNVQYINDLKVRYKVTAAPDLKPDVYPVKAIFTNGTVEGDVLLLVTVN